MTKVSISASIPRLLNEIKRTDVVHKKDIIADYVMEGVGLIGTFHDFDLYYNVPIDIENHSGKLPYTTVDVEDVHTCDSPWGGWTGGWRAHCSCNNTPCGCYSSYSKAAMKGWKLEDCSIWVPQASGVVTADLWMMPLDAEGMPLLYEGTAMAIRAYLRYVFSESLFEEGLINQGVFDRRKARWDELCTITRNAQLVPDRQRLSYAARINNDPLKSRRYYGRR